MLMRFDPFREFDRLVDQVWNGLPRPAAMPIDAYRQGDHLVVRFDLPGVPSWRIAEGVATMRVHADPDPVRMATKTALATLGRRAVSLGEEGKHLDVLIARLVDKVAPELVETVGVGPDTAALLLIAAGDNPSRLRNEATWAKLCGVAPLEASSGKVTRHRLNRGGDRQANHALWRIVLTRMSCHAPTKVYVARRTAEGKSKREIMRILKRYVAREIYHYLPRD
jgi:transposase